MLLEGVNTIYRCLDLRWLKLRNRAQAWTLVCPNWPIPPPLQTPLLPIGSFPQQEVPLQPLMTLDPRGGVGIATDEVVETPADGYHDGTILAGYLGVAGVLPHLQGGPGLCGQGDDVADRTLVTVDDTERLEGVRVSHQEIARGYADIEVLTEES